MPVKLIVGLGNPGSKYAGTRHNMGRELVEAFARGRGLKFSRKSRLQSSVASMEEDGKKVILAYPETFMNLSGDPVARLKKFFKVRTASVLVVVDDLDLPLGKLRLRAQGSSGGHNGLKSVETALGSRDFARLRIGIGRPGECSDPGSSVPDHVLSAFTAPETEVIRGVLEEKGQEALDLWINGSMANAMNHVNS